MGVVDAGGVLVRFSECTVFMTSLSNIQCLSTSLLVHLTVLFAQVQMPLVVGFHERIGWKAQRLQVHN